MIRTMLTIFLLPIIFTSLPSTIACPCKLIPVRDQVCHSDFVGIVELQNQAYDSGLNASRFESKYIDIFRTNFIAEADQSTTVWARHLICGHQRKNMTFVENTNATEENKYFLVTNGNQRHLSVSICASIIHQWQQISANDKKKLTKTYIESACACLPSDTTCLDTFNFDFLAAIDTN